MAAISTGFFNFSSGHQDMSSRGFIKAQGQVLESKIPMMPSSNQWLFSSTVLLQRNTGSTFSRDIQEAVKNKLSSDNAPSIQTGNHIHCNTVCIHQDLNFNHTSWENHSIQLISQYGKVYTPLENQYTFQSSIQDYCQPERVKLSAFHIYQPPLTLAGFSPS
ncbi:hypothetical protein O181_126157 [Austropuccinia psidii MF-1]|uniref:Uncharacterized protein n=1 Tax=Austropuccinia psidii MF-1 TaxID=1389203 RepID=A0A9Q3KVD4_9BASI|nr:hypothetical protein [Austropuccinia psidii MF-1]